MKRKVYVILREGNVIFLTHNGASVSLPSFEVDGTAFEYRSMISGMKSIFPEFNVKSVRETFEGTLGSSLENGKKIEAYVFVIKEATGWRGEKTEQGIEVSTESLDALKLPYPDGEIISRLRKFQEERRLI